MPYRLLLALVRGALGRIVLVSDGARGVQWAHPDDASAEAPPYVLTDAARALLQQAEKQNGLGEDGIVTVNGRAFQLAALYRDGMHVADFVSP